LKNLKSGGLHVKHAVATWNLGTISEFDYKAEKPKKTCVELASRVKTKSTQIGSDRAAKKKATLSIA
jgi:hypothetical protein